MGPLFNIFAGYPYLGLLEGAFTIWMLVDAYRRQADFFWFWIILLLQPIGPWIYFFAVKWGDFAFRFSSGSLFQHRASLAELEYQADKVPTLASHMALAQRLIERKEYDDAIPHLEAALVREPDHCQVLYGLAVCYSEKGESDKALPYLDRILQRDRRWSDYAAMRLVVRARTETGDGANALGAARELARLSPTLQHQCLLAECLVAEGLSEEAGRSLQQSLEVHRFAPSPSRRKNRSWAREARRLQKQIDSK